MRKAFCNPIDNSKQRWLINTNCTYVDESIEDIQVFSKLWEGTDRKKGIKSPYCVIRRHSWRRNIQGSVPFNIAGRSILPAVGPARDCVLQEAAWLLPLYCKSQTVETFETEAVSEDNPNRWIFYIAKIQKFSRRRLFDSQKYSDEAGADTGICDVLLHHFVEILLLTRTKRKRHRILL